MAGHGERRTAGGGGAPRWGRVGVNSHKQLESIMIIDMALLLCWPHWPNHFLITKLDLKSIYLKKKIYVLISILHIGSLI